MVVASLQGMSLPVVEILGELWELPDPALRDRWARCLRPGAQGRQLGGADAPYHWTSRATVQSIQARAGEWLMFHAAGLSTADGDVAALIGPSGTGKSTAARTLCRDHFGYVTDETVAVLPNGSVAPFAKPIAVVPKDGGIKLEFGPDELGLLPCSEDLRLTGLLLLERNDGMTEPVIEPLELLEGLLAIIPQISALAHLEDALTLLADVVEQCGGLAKITYGDADQLAEVVRHILAVPPVRSGFRSHAFRGAAEGAGIVRAEYNDALELDGRVLVLKGSLCALLQGIGALVWLAADQPITPSDLRAEIIAEVGDHPEAGRLIQETVDELVSLGVLESR